MQMEMVALKTIRKPLNGITKLLHKNAEAKYLGILYEEGFG